MDASNVVSAAQWIGSSLNQEANALSGVKNQVENLKKELQFMQQYLQDADEKKEVAEDHTLISHMRQLAFDAEDVIDSYVLKVHANQPDENWLVRNAHFLINIPHIYTVKEQIEQVQSGLKQITEKLKTYGLTQITEPIRKRKQFPRSYPYDDDNGEYVVGLDKDIPTLIRVLKGDEMDKVRGLAIVGMGGSGKTTLARKLYNHPFIRESFNCKAWVSVSQDWNTAYLLSEILRQVGGLKETTTTKLNNDESNVPELVAELRDILEKKSYLVVLDDVWGSKALKEMRPVLLCGNVSGRGKIIITSRNVEIAEFQNLQTNLYSYEPKPLNEEEGWKLFSKIALTHRTDYNKEKFVNLGKEMLRKCYGLPLAIVVLAGILNTKGSYEEWLPVSKAVRSRVMQGSCTNTYGSVQDLLALSYDDLPYEIKPCFLYLSAFPEDCKIPSGMLIRMWIAEGLVVAHDEEELTLEEVAMQRLEELSHRFLVQVVRTNFKGVIKKIQIHDLLRDLCVKKAREQSFLQIYTSINNSTSMRADTSTKAIQSRRAALHSSTYFPRQVSNLRSLLLLTKSSILHSAYDIRETLNLKIVTNHFKLLRMLNLWGIRTSSGTLPAQVGNLIHLRYLGVRASNITRLPTSIGNLRNLLTLDYRNIPGSGIVPVKVPKSLYKLTLLRHLFLPVERPLDKKQLVLSSLKGLQILWGIRCEGGDWFSREMKTLSTTVEKLKVVVSTEENLEAAFRCPSLMSPRIRTFHCEWNINIALHRINPVFHHSQHLHKLVLVGKIQVDNLTLILPSNLAILELKDSMLEEWDGNDNPMVAIGSLSHLKVLKLSNAYLGSTFICRSGSFPALEELYVKNLKNLKIWSVCEDAMSSLKKLVILYCEMLREFPQGLPFMATLQQLEYFEVPDEFGDKATECGWSEQMLKLPHNIGAIVKSCDSPVDVSTISKLHEQLTAGVFLKNKKEKFWVMKKHARYYNYFMLYPQKSYEVCECALLGGRWEYSQMEESGGELVRVGKLKAAPTDTSVPIVRGEFMVKYLTPKTTYEVAFLVMLPLSTFKRGMPAVCCSTDIYESTSSELCQQEHHLSDRPRDEWIRLSAGEFKTPLSSSDSIFIVFTLTNIPVGLVIQGVIFEPKLELLTSTHSFADPSL